LIIFLSVKKAAIYVVKKSWSGIGQSYKYTSFLFKLKYVKKKWKNAACYL
jgi:hypothetical protein